MSSVQTKRRPPGRGRTSKAAVPRTSRPGCFTVQTRRVPAGDLHLVDQAERPEAGGARSGRRPRGRTRAWPGPWCARSTRAAGASRSPRRPRPQRRPIAHAGRRSARSRAWAPRADGAARRPRRDFPASASAVDGHACGTRRARRPAGLAGRRSSRGGRDRTVRSTSGRSGRSAPAGRPRSGVAPTATARRARWPARQLGGSRTISTRPILGRSSRSRTASR